MENIFQELQDIIKLWKKQCLGVDKKDKRHQTQC